MRTSSEPAWHALSAPDVLRQLDAVPEGLGPRAAQERLAQHGPNSLPEAPPANICLRLLRQFNNTLLIVLMVAASVTAWMGHWVDTTAIVAVVVLNAVIGFVQEGKAEKALAAIRHLLAPHAVVMRDGRAQDVAAVDLVPGDVVLLASGDSLPADVRLLQARNLRVDESALTGESVPVDKGVEPQDASVALADRRCMAYAGTLVTQGQARAVVVATGANTEMGRIGGLLQTVEAGSTPLLRKMEALGRTLTFSILMVAALLFVYAAWVLGTPWDELFIAVVGLAVAAIPEGLPAILTITLAIGVQRMAGRHAVVRRLPAVETLGSVTVICSDKTGTLTRNEMTVQRIVCDGQVFAVTGAGYAPEGELRWQSGDGGVPSDPGAAVQGLVQAAALCNDASLHDQEGHWVLAGDPTEGALLTLAMKAGVMPVAAQIDAPRVEVIPFESEYRYMATLHEGDDGAQVWLKGAPERVLAMCSHQMRPDGTVVPLQPGPWHEAIEAQAREGRRVLALAGKHLPPGTVDLDHAQVADGLCMLGLVGIIDPPRDEAIRAVAQCRAAGIRVTMITGDHAVTASAIAAQLGMGDGAQAREGLQTLTGPEIEALDDAALQEAVVHTRVFARASPEHKLRLVRALQARGEVVAMTGDGVNDAPALKQADVGVAMGLKGTEAAKQAGAIVLGDDNFATIANAVEEGRTVYDNLRKTITFLLPINGGESLSLLVAIVLGLNLPIAPAQILWVNMVSSLALALVLAFEPTEQGVMRRPPRPAAEPLLTRFVVWRVLLVSVMFLLGIFGLHEWALQQGLSVEAARTVSVNALVCMEVFYLFSVRYLRAGSFTVQGVKGTPRVLMAVAAVMVLQVFFTYTPFMHTLFGSEPLPAAVLPAVVGTGVAVFALLEIEKWTLRRWRVGRPAQG